MTRDDKLTEQYIFIILWIYDIILSWAFICTSLESKLLTVITLSEIFMDVILGHLVEIGKKRFSNSSQARGFKAYSNSLTSNARMTSSMGLTLYLR